MELLVGINKIASPVLDIIFEAVTMFGEQTVLAMVFCLVYWCVDKKTGFCLLIGLCASLCLNGLIKDFVKAPRPFWEPGVTAKRVETATGYSFPSGHTQSAAAFWAGLALWLKRRIVSVIAVAIILLVGFSRLYLGVHYLPDVVCGAVLGTVCAAAAPIALAKLSRLTVLFAVGILAVCCLAFGESPDTLATAGLVCGIIPGFFVERRVNFSMPERFSQAAVRLLAGGLLICVIYILSKLIFERSVLILFFRGALISFITVGGYPWLFSAAERSRFFKKTRS